MLEGKMYQSVQEPGMVATVTRQGTVSQSGVDYEVIYFNWRNTEWQGKRSWKGFSHMVVSLFELMFTETNEPFLPTPGLPELTTSRPQTKVVGGAKVRISNANKKEQGYTGVIDISDETELKKFMDYTRSANGTGGYQISVSNFDGQTVIKKYSAKQYALDLLSKN